MCSSQEPGYISVYIWPKGHDPEADLPDNFYSDLSDALAAAGYEMENQ